MGSNCSSAAWPHLLRRCSLLLCLFLLVHGCRAALAAEKAAAEKLRAEGAAKDSASKDALDTVRQMICVCVSVRA